LTVDFSAAILDRVMAALEARQTMSEQALDSSKARAGLKSTLRGPARLNGALRGTTRVPEVIG
jgi:type I restriction enzyme R subunit